MVRLVLVGSFVVIAALTLLLSVSVLVLGHDYVTGRVVLGAIIAMFLSIIAIVLSRGQTKLAAWMLILLYSTVASTILWFWGINSPIGILTLSFVILLAGSTLGARSIVPVALLLVLILCGLELTVVFGIHSPDVSKLDDTSSFGDVASYVAIFGIFALISWMSIRRTELALRKAQNAELALQEEKAQLAYKLEERTRNLREAQLEEMRNLYRFAELGQLTSLILHELSNHLSVLTLDIDEIGSHRADTRIIRQAKESVHYIDTMIRQARRQLVDSTESHSFNIFTTINEIKDNINANTKSHKVDMAVKTKLPRRKSFLVMGDPLRLSQVLTVLITNALQASANTDSGKRFGVILRIEIKDSKAYIHVIDHGTGISPKERLKIFEPLHSTKKNGLGVGLFIAKQIVDTHFKGKLRLLPTRSETHFVIMLREYTKP